MAFWSSFVLDVSVFLYTYILSQTNKFVNMILQKVLYVKCFILFDILPHLFRWGIPTSQTVAYVILSHFVLHRLHRLSVPSVRWFHKPCGTVFIWFRLLKVVFYLHLRYLNLYAFSILFHLLWESDLNCIIIYEKCQELTLVIPHFRYSDSLTATS